MQQGIQFESYHIDKAYLITVLIDKPSSVHFTGPGEPISYPYQDYLSLPPTVDNIEHWQAYLNKKFSLREDKDAALIVPLKDSGKDVKGDYQLFSEADKVLWNYQINLVFARFKSFIDKANSVTPSIFVGDIRVEGANARVNINSTDLSQNSVNQVNPQIFNDLRSLINQEIDIKSEQNRMINAVNDMEKAYGSSSFKEKYQEFMAAAANHVTVLAPLLPFLALLL